MVIHRDLKLDNVSVPGRIIHRNLKLDNVCARQKRDSSFGDLYEHGLQ